MNKASVISGFLLLVLGLLLISTGVNKLRLNQQSVSWPVVTGTVLHASITSDLDEDHEMRYRPIVRYEYTIGNKSHTNDNIGFRSGDYRDEEEAQQVIAPYIKGKPVSVYYQSDKPDRSVLQPGGSSGAAWFIVPGVFLMALAGSMLCFLLWSWFRG